MKICRKTFLEFYDYLVEDLDKFRKKRVEEIEEWHKEHLEKRTKWQKTLNWIFSWAYDDTTIKFQTEMLDKEVSRHLHALEETKFIAERDFHKAMIQSPDDFEH